PTRIRRRRVAVGDPLPVLEVTAKRFLEGQRARPRDSVDFDQWGVLLVATAVGFSARDPGPADVPDEGAGRTGEPPGAAVDCGRLRRFERSGAGPRIYGKRHVPAVDVDDVKRAPGEHKIVAADLR